MPAGPRNEFGFLRMWSIYPTRSTPSSPRWFPIIPALKKAAKSLLAAQEAAWGPIQFEGELHDRATYRYFGNWCRRRRSPGRNCRRRRSGRVLGDLPGSIWVVLLLEIPQPPFQRGKKLLSLFNGEEFIVPFEKGGFRGFV